MLELLAGIQAVRHVTRERLGEGEPPRRRRAPARPSRLATARHLVSDAMVALTVPWPAEAPPVTRARCDLRPD